MDSSDTDEKNANTLHKLFNRPNLLLCAIVLGNTLVNVTIAILGFNLATNHFQTLGVVITIIILIVVLIVFTGIFSIVLPKLLNLDPPKRLGGITEDDLRSIVDVSHEEGVIEHEEKQIIHNVFDFSDTQAKDIMIPRIDMTFINIDVTYEDLMAIHEENTYTRYPVYEDSTDSVIGTINTKDLLFYDNSKGDFSLRPFLREPHFTYEHKNSSALFIEMRNQSINFMIVLDEYGATTGLITLEDMLEEIVGDIRDEYDDEEDEKVITTIAEGHEYIVRGDAKLDDINDELKLQLESDEYDSLGGYIIERLDRIPDEAEDILLEDGTQLVIDKLSNNRIELVHVHIHTKNAET